MTKYRVHATISASVYIGDVEAETLVEACKKGRALYESIKNKRPRYDDGIDGELAFDSFESVELVKPGDVEYVPMRWR